MESWKDLNQLIEYSSGGIISRELIKSPNGNVTLFCLASGAAISEHTATCEGFVYVIEGNGTFNLAGEEISMRKGIIIPMGGNAVHSLQADENTSFILTLFKK